MRIKNIKNIMNIKNISGWWVTGLVDAEGNFSINYNSRSKKVNFSFKVSQKSHSMCVLVRVLMFFGCGNIVIDNKQFSCLKFTVSNKDLLLNIIIPHFEKFPLKGSKQLEFLAFKEAVILSCSLDNTKLNKILYIKSKMNTKRSFDERWYYLDHINIAIEPEWLQGFIDGEGCFYCAIVNTVKISKPYLAVNLTLDIAQNSHDVKLLYHIREYLNEGYLKPKYDINSLIETKKARSVTRLVINNKKKIIDFVDKYPLYSLKSRDYLDWKKLNSLKELKKHQTDTGLEEMFSIKNNMNQGRIIIDTKTIVKSNIVKPSDKLKYFNWIKNKVNNVNSVN